VRGRGVCDNLFMRGFAFFGAVPSSLHSVVHIQPIGTSGAKVFCLFFLFSFSAVSSSFGSNCPYLITQSRALSPEGKFFCHFIGFS
jgi:hypothetical protein